MPLRVLVVDAGFQILAPLKNLLVAEGADVIIESDATRGLDALQAGKFDVLFTNARLPGRIELELLRTVREHLPNLPVVVVTDSPAVDLAISALRLGAIDYLMSPFRPDQVAAALARAIATLPPATPQKPCAKLQRTLTIRQIHSAIVAVSPAMKQLARMCPRAASSSLPTLVVGDTGVGKNRLVRWIHILSPRSAAPFIVVNCDGIQESQLAEMFFGKSAAVDGSGDPSRRGFIEQAAGGTLFLRNVTGLPRWMQTEVLQAAQAGVFQRPGGSAPIPFLARLAASTFGPPADSVQNGSLLRELHSYLGVIALQVPSLRNRREDIRPLIRDLEVEISGELSSAHHLPRRSFTDEAIQILEEHVWSGNVLELSNFIRRMFVFVTRAEVTAADVNELLPTTPALRGTDTITVPFLGNLKLMERAIVAEVLHRTKGNKAEAAPSLGLHRKALYRIMEKDSLNAG